MKLFVSFALTTALITGCSVASADRSYVAKVNENGKFCTHVKTDGDWRSRRVCKTIEEWKSSGYRVDVKKPVGSTEVLKEV